MDLTGLFSRLNVHQTVIGARHRGCSPYPAISVQSAGWDGKADKRQVDARLDITIRRETPESGYIDRPSEYVARNRCSSGGAARATLECFLEICAAPTPTGDMRKSLLRRLKTVSRTNPWWNIAQAESRLGIRSQKFTGEIVNQFAKLKICLAVQIRVNEKVVW